MPDQFIVSVRLKFILILRIVSVMRQKKLVELFTSSNIFKR